MMRYAGLCTSAAASSSSLATVENRFRSHIRANAAGWRVLDVYVSFAIVLLQYIGRFTSYFLYTLGKFSD